MSIMVAQLCADEIQAGVDVLDNTGAMWGRVTELQWIARSIELPLVIVAEIHWGNGVDAIEQFNPLALVIARFESDEEIPS